MQPFANDCCITQSSTFTMHSLSFANDCCITQSSMFTMHSHSQASFGDVPHLQTVISIHNEEPSIINKGLREVVRMESWSIWVLYLLCTHLKMANGEDTINAFIIDIMATFQLHFPTIIYEGEEALEICFSDQWTHCLSMDEYVEGILAQYAGKA